MLGAAGFIGRWVARALCGAGAQTWLVVRNAAAASQVFQQFAVTGESVQVDLMDTGALRSLLNTVRPAIVFNLAGYGVDPNERDPRLAHALNIELVTRLAEACAEACDRSWPGTQLMHAGSALEYGRAVGTLAEDTIPLPTTLYGQTKLGGTRALMDVCARTGLAAVTARLFTVYGPGEAPGRLLPLLIAAARTREQLPLTMGVQRRDFTYVEDVAEGLLRLGLARSGPGDVVNLATGQLHGVREFAEIAAGVLGLSADRLEFGALPTRVEEMEHDPVSVKRLQQITGWLPKTSIADGIRQTFEFTRLSPSA